MSLCIRTYYKCLCYKLQINCWAKQAPESHATNGLLRSVVHFSKVYFYFLHERKKTNEKSKEKNDIIKDTHIAPITKTNDRHSNGWCIITRDSKWLSLSLAKVFFVKNMMKGNISLLNQIHSNEHQERRTVVKHWHFLLH